MGKWPHQKKPFDSQGYAAKLRACSSLSDAHKLHTELIDLGWSDDKFIGNHLVQTYGRLGSPQEAHSAFSSLRWRNVFSWTILLAAFAQNGYLHQARITFDRMPEHKTVSWNALMGGLSDAGDLGGAREIFDRLPEKDTISWNTMVTAYAQKGQVHEAEYLFVTMPEKNVVSWTAILTAYAQAGHLVEAKSIFDTMPERNVVSWNSLTAAYAQSGHMDPARAVFDKTPLHDTISWNSIIAVYTRNGLLEEADALFRRIPAPDVMSWTSVLWGYAEAGEVENAERVFFSMPERDAGTWNAMVSAYGQARDLERAKHFFEKIPHRNLRSWTSMFLAYSQMADLEETRRVFFEEMPERDLVSWNALLTAYARNERGLEALQLFSLMDIEGVEPNGITFICVIDACASSRSLARGRLVDSEIGGNRGSVELGNCFITMYAKCGSFDNARRHFRAMHERDTVTWTAMITAEVESGRSLHGLQLFLEMVHDGVLPHDVTFLGVLSACAYEGRVRDGIEYWYVMVTEFEVCPRVEHYAWVVNLLARAGKLTEAEELIECMPYEPEFATWGALLGGCSLSGSTFTASRAAKWISAMTPDNSSPEGDECGAMALFLRRLRAQGSLPTRVNVRRICLIVNSRVIDSYNQEGDGETHALALTDSGREMRHDLIIRSNAEPDAIAGFSLPKEPANYGAMSELIGCKTFKPSRMDNELVNDLSRLLRQGNVSAWEAEDIVRSNGGVLTPYHICEVLKTYGDNVDLAYAFFKWADIYKGYEHDQFSCNAILKVLGTHGRFDDMKMVIKGMEEQMIPITYVTYRILLRTYIEASMIEDALETFYKMERCEIRPTLEDYNYFMIKLIKLGCSQVVPLIFKSMRRHKVTPNTMSYNFIISSFCILGQMEEAHKHLSIMKKSCRPDEFTYSSLINGYCKCFESDISMKLFREMLIYRLKPNLGLFNMMMDCHARTGKHEMVIELFERMIEEEIRPDAKSYRILVDSFAVLGRLDETFTFLERFCESEYAPNLGAFNTLMNRLGRANKAHAALEVFQRIKDKPNYKPDLVTYNIVLDLLGKAGRLQEAWSLYTRMKTTVTPDKFTYNTLMARMGKAGKLETCLMVLDDMNRDGILPDHMTYAGLIEGSARDGKLEIAMGYFEEMKRFGYYPNVATIELLINASIKAGKFLAADELLKEVNAATKKTGLSPQIPYSSTKMGSHPVSSHQ